MARANPPINGDVLYQQRLDLGLTQLQVTELTEQAGFKIADSNLSKIEHGKIQHPTPRTVHVLGKVLGLTREQMHASCGTCRGDWSAACMDHGTSQQPEKPEAAEDIQARTKQPSAA